MLIIDIYRWSSADFHIVSGPPNPRRGVEKGPLARTGKDLRALRLPQSRAFCGPYKCLQSATVSRAKLISSCSRGQACFVHQSGHGLAEIVARHAIEAGVPKGLAHHLEGVIRVA